MRRLVYKTAQVVIDLLVLSLAFPIAFMLRFDWDIPANYVRPLVFTWVYVVACQYGLLMAFRVTRYSWRYIGLRDAPRILLASMGGTVALLAIRWLAGYVLRPTVPLGVILIDSVLVFLGIAGVRLLWRISGEHRASDRRRTLDGSEVPTMLIGAGRAGVLVAKEISSRPDLEIRAVGFLDDDRVKKGSVIHGIPVVGTTEQAAEMCVRYGATQALITIASARGSDIRRIEAICDEANIPAKIIPGIYEIVGGKVNLSRIRPVAIEDLLGREQVLLDEEAISAFIRRKVILVTGAGGSIGSDLCRQAARFGPARLILVEHCENALFESHGELTSTFPEIEVVPIIADITDSGRMERIFDESRPDVVFHAAAHKHVPMMEWNPGEAIKNNVLGTKAVADLAARFDVGHFVMISTDKAVNPTSVMGASKRVAELYIQGMAQRQPGTKFVSVRFGNVLGSSGSVLPIFKRQIAEGGPVTITHPAMKRYFMTIPEATQLVLQAASMGEGGEVFILDMGEPVAIVDLARDLIRLSGFEVGKDVEIQFTGVRPGEKLYEELATDEERADKTRHEKIFIGRVQLADWGALERGIHELAADTDALDEHQIYEALRTLIPEFSGAMAKATRSPRSSR